jgi:hypothetical protein
MNTWLHQEDQQNVSIKHRHSNHLSFRHRHSNNSTLPIVFLSLKLPPPPCAVIYWYINWQNMQVSCTNEHMHIGGAFCNFVAYTVFMNSFPQFSTDVVHDNWGKWTSLNKKRTQVLNHKLFCCSQIPMPNLRFAKIPDSWSEPPIDWITMAPGQSYRFRFQLLRGWLSHQLCAVTLVQAGALHSACGWRK